MTFTHRYRLIPLLALFVAGLLGATEIPGPAVVLTPLPPASPEETIKRIYLPDGYRLELVVSEPHTREPVVCVFDGNGRMYLAEMRTYMQDLDATDQNTTGGCVTRHESTRGDGVFDKHSVYAEKLLLPRMVLPLDDRVLINETDTNDIYTYRDTNGDGVSDTKELFYAGGKRGGNMEHQQSGLIWAMDNWMYQTVNAFRLRFTNGQVVMDKTPGTGSQWGLCQDDLGKVWFSNGGGERGPVNFQVPIIYGAISVSGEMPKDFKEVYPLVGLADVQGGAPRFRPDTKTLNHFTATCGQQIFRGDRLPEDLRGDLLICEPVGRLIRRIKITNDGGMTFLSHPHGKSEFIRSTDPNFRPVNMTTGPDGCLYIVDMYRGIIQEGNWTKKDSYLRKAILEHGLEKNIQRGRVWRLVHKDFKPGPQPRMLDETPAQLVAHLEHPNGWWRDTAQRLLVLRADKSVVPALEAMVRTHANPLARMHALWTLEGLDALDKELFHALLKDANPRIRVAAMRAGETILKKADEALRNEIQSMKADKDPDVFLQVLMTAKRLNWPGYPKFTQLALKDAPTPNARKIGMALANPEESFDKNLYAKPDIDSLHRGREIYQELCFACHGIDGMGAPLEGAKPGLTLAPPLSGSRNVMEDREALIRILLHGMGGPINGKTYDAQMVPMAGNDDLWVADIASYIRNTFGNSGPCVTWMDVARLRAQFKDRATPWTDPELQTLAPLTLKNTKEWNVSASHNTEQAREAIDGKLDSRWASKADQAPGMWFQIELPKEESVNGVWLSFQPSAKDFPRAYKVELSGDGKAWGKPVAQGKGSLGLMEIRFPAASAKFIRITQTDSPGGKKKPQWNINELRIFSPAPDAPKDARKRLLVVTLAVGERRTGNFIETILTEMAERTGGFAVDVLKPATPRPVEPTAPVRADKDTDESFAAKVKKAKTDAEKFPAEEAAWRENLKKLFAEKFSVEALKNYDGVIFADTTGDLPLPDVDAFAAWVKSGKAFIGIHGAADTLRGSKPYIELLGGEAAGRPWSGNVTLKLNDLRHPATSCFESTFEVGEPPIVFTNWSRSNVHPLISVDASNDKKPKRAGKPGEPEKGFLELGGREDKDYAVAWTRDAEKGRVFYTAMGRTESEWLNPGFQQHIYGGIRWALGLAESRGKPVVK